jgi:hypothetical protein
MRRESGGTIRTLSRDLGSVSVTPKGEAMKRKLSLLVAVTLVAVFGLVQGCSRGPSEEELKLVAFQEQVAATKAAYEELRSLRSENATAGAILAELEAIPENKLTDEQKAQLDDVKGKLEASATTTEAKFEEVQSQLADALNIGINDFPDSPETAELLIIYSDEAILVAEDMVMKAGDYKKAIDHLSNAEGYFAAAGLTPYHPLIAKIAEFDDWRFINQERFDAITKGMSREEVTETAGHVYYRNIQKSESKGVETWLYKKREGGAAAVYFKIKTGKVYDKNFDAIEVRAVED